MVARVAETGEPENLESYSGFTGRWYSVRYYSPRSGITAAITSDITHNKISEEVLRESEDRYRTISQLTSDFAFSFHISPEGQPIVDWTAGAIESISGYTIEEMPTFEQWAEVIHPDDLNQLREKMMYQMIRGGDLQVDVCLTAKNGEQRWLHVITKAVRDGAGKVVRINGAAQNITERHRLEEKITFLRREQEAFLRHEMKNLFAPIQLFAELVLDSENLTMNQTYYLQRIVETSKRVGEFIDALKRIQDIENGRYILNRVRQSLNSIIKRAIQNLEPLAKKSGVFIRLQEHEEEAVLLLDPNLMPGVFTNLIQNAIEHVIGLKKSEERIVTVGLTREKNRYVICIHNWGAPIPPERVNTFFEKFNVGPEKRNGTGLGTTYAYLVAKAHGGDIQVTSNAEEGTTVTIILPIGR
jgi:PAS domain S-box-containing protein